MRRIAYSAPDALRVWVLVRIDDGSILLDSRVAACLSLKAAEAHARMHNESSEADEYVIPCEFVRSTGLARRT
jgi:hypothetical protein